MKNNAFKLTTLSLATALAITLTGCGGDSEGSTTATAYAPVEATGQFIDAAVGNLEVYQNGKKIDTTDSEGKFKYMTGSEVTFKLGQLILGSTLPKDIITPADLSATTDNVIEILQALQSLDEDGNPDNGIFIAQTTIDKLVTALDLSEDDVSIADTIKKDIPSLIVVAKAKAMQHFAKSQGVIKQAKKFGQKADKLVGYWYDNHCNNKEKVILELAKVADADNSVEVVGGLINKYANGSCTGNVVSTHAYVPKTTDIKWTVVGTPNDGAINVFFENDLGIDKLVPSHLASLKFEGNNITIYSGVTNDTYSLLKLDSLAFPIKEALSDMDTALASLSDGWWYDADMCQGKTLIASKYGKIAADSVGVTQGKLVTFAEQGCQGDIVSVADTTAEGIDFIVESVTKMPNGEVSIATPAAMLQIQDDIMTNSQGMTFKKLFIQ